MNSMVSENKNNPLVSVVVPSYNHGDYIQQCIDSVIKQDYVNIELIIIDDGSIDNSVQNISMKLNECKDRFVRFEFRHRNNKGLPATLNEALAWAKGEYFAQIGSDDILHVNKTSRLIECIENEKDVAGVFSECSVIDGSGLHVEYGASKLNYFDFVDVIKHKHSLHASTQLLRRHCLVSVGGYAEDIYLEDWYMWLKLTEAGYKLKSIPDVLVKYRVHDGNMSGNESKMFDARFKVLSYFIDNPLHGYAYANICVWGAVRYSCINKKKSFNFLLKAIVSSKRIMVTRYFAKGFFCTVAPRYIVRRYFQVA